MLPGFSRLMSQSSPSIPRPDSGRIMHRLEWWTFQEPLLVYITLWTW